MLRSAFPEAGWLSEESADDPARLARSSLLVLDPIDGTRAFMSGDPCWTVAIALVEDGRPIAGVVHAPALGETFAASLGRGATLNGEPIRAASLATLDGVRVAGPRPLVSAFAAEAGFRWEPAARTPSLAYRLASVAAGRIPLGLAGANSHDWDICAADVILREAGAGLHRRRRRSRLQQSEHPPRAAARRARALAAAPRASAGGDTGGGGTAGMKIATPAAQTHIEASHMSEIAAHDSKQLLHLVLGGELKNIDSMEFKDTSADRHRRRLPQLRERREGLARQGAGDGRQRPDALFHRPPAPHDRARRPRAEGRLTPA